MKKTYIIPVTQVTVIRCEKLMSDSFRIDGNQTAGESAGGFVKGDPSSSSSYTPRNYNVWEDDWTQ